MRDGFVKVAVCTPDLKVADCEYNRGCIEDNIGKMAKNKAVIMVFPELGLTGYTCNDLFLQDTLLTAARQQLCLLARNTTNIDALLFVGLPLSYSGKIYNVTAVLNHGEILAFIPKSYIPNYCEFYEKRYFTEGPEEPMQIRFEGRDVWFGTDILLQCEGMEHLVVSAEICEDLWVPAPPSISHATNGATVIVNLSASDEVTGKDGYRRALVLGQSARLLCAYVYAAAGDGESTQDLVFGGHGMIAENGTMLSEADRFVNDTIYADIDVERLATERRKMTTFEMGAEPYVTVPFDVKLTQTKLTRTFPAYPFVPSDKGDKDRRCDEILMIQAMGLKKRLIHTGCKCAVIGISGGLDSTLALLVTARAFDLAGLPRRGILAVTMPCFGTTDRTYQNACTLAKQIGATLREVQIEMAVMQHFKDIEQNTHKHDVTYENAQARERTQVLMDLANQKGGIVIGTGDLSELALGWATYNGDHMSMYGVNASIPKTLIRHLVGYYADTCKDSKLRQILLDVLDTPVSPELLPPTKGGRISQKTEELVGPYELHDFFLYHMLRGCYPPKKIYRIAKQTFKGKYTSAVILKWEKTFYRRFFAQQFKRSCLPDGPKVGTVAVSPRGDLRMPSDASAAVWLQELEEIGGKE